MSEDPDLRVGRWRRSLLDLTLRNRLLDARVGRTCLALGGDPIAMAARLDDGAELDADFVVGGEELARSLVAIARAARESLAEGGAHTLWVALGLLRWPDGEGQPRHAPLVLWPVEIKKAGEGVRIVGAATEEPRVNETLVEKLRIDHQIAVAVPPADDDGELYLEPIFEAFAAAVAGREGWELVREARLGIFSFTKFVMWNDLGARAGELLDSGVVRALATGVGFPEQEAFPGVDASLGSECPLDADTTQLAAIAAATAGRTFVLQGPPGTGKSQTISNLIARCLADGKTVLFVSEKMAALEVVQRRLAAAGLGDFCLELHSHRASKRAVLDDLGRVLERAWRPVAAAGEDEKLIAARDALDGYARAMHAPTAIGLSIHESLERLLALADAPKLSVELDEAQVAPGWLPQRRDALSEYAAAWNAAGSAQAWRDSDLAEWQLSTRDAVAAVLTELDGALRDLDKARGDLERAVPGLRPTTKAQLAAVAKLAEVAARSPRPGAELIADETVSERALVKVEVPRTPTAWLAIERRRRAVRADVFATWQAALIDGGAAVASAPDDDELAALSARFRKWADRFGLWRWLALRKARARLRPLATGALPPDLQIADDLDAAAEARRCERALDEADAPARRWLGALAVDDLRATDLDAVERALAWAAELRDAWTQAAPAVVGDRGAAWRAVVAAVTGEPGEVPWREAQQAIERALLAIERLATVCVVRVPDSEEPSAWLRERLPGWQGAIGALRDWTAYVRARRGVEALGLAPVTAACERGEVPAAKLADAWERAVLFPWTDARIREHDVLRDFHGAQHHARVTEFADLDRASLATARARLIMRLAERVPRVSPGAALDGEMGILLHELKKQRRHRPLRSLFAKMPALLGRLKPCMLMSPLSVAQYLDPALPKFDVIVFDEASQIPTADAIGALARGTSAVIVGDSRQLPPTRFFEITRTDELAGEDEYEELESILDECVAARVPELRLGWHYRSKHEDLIAFSNRRYYGDRLHVFPSPAARVADLGVTWRKIDGVYDRSRTRTNRAEAGAVVAEVLQRLRADGPRRSLGIVTFNRAQQELIEDLLDDARRADPSLDAHFASDDPAAEPVIVKNLETIQGDERDVVLFSIGYGPDEQGAVTMNFGPLNRDGGERRLNVAVTRAREQLVVFSSIEPEAISKDVAAIGVRHLGELLAYVKAGGGSAAEVAAAETPSPMIAQLAEALTSRGWTVRTGVGCAAYQLDLAVVDPDDPGRYVIAIECDGPSYASAPAARDRDRLRAQVLTQLGWRLHRVWSLDWWHDRERELQKVQSVVIAAVAAARSARKPKTPAAPRAVAAAASGPIAKSGPVPATRMPTAPTAPMRGAESSPTKVPPRSTMRAPAVVAPKQARLFEKPSAQVVPYRAASIPAGRRTPDDLILPKYEPELVRMIDQVLEVEAPVHVDLLCRRVAAYFGIGRLSPKVVERVREVAKAKIGDDEIAWRLDQDPDVPPPVRAADAAAETRRDADEIPLAEIAAAASIVLGRDVGLDLDDLVRETAKLLGFARTGERVQKRMRAGIEQLAARGGCTIEGERATVA